MPIVKIPVPAVPKDYRLYGGSHERYVVIGETRSPKSLIFYTISPDRGLNLNREFSHNSPSPQHTITGFEWYPKNPSIFFTCTNWRIITCHCIIESEKRVEIIGTIEIEFDTFSFTINSTGTKMAVVLSDGEDQDAVEWFSLSHSTEDGTMSFTSVSFTVFDNLKIKCMDFLDANIIAFGLTDRTIYIDENGEQGRNTEILQTNGVIVAVRFSPDGHFFAVAATRGFSIYVFDRKRFVFRLVVEFVDEDYFCSKVTLEWHISLPLLVCTFVKNFVGINGKTKIRSFSVTDFGVELLHSEKIDLAAINGVFIDHKLPIVMFSYYGAIKGEVLALDFSGFLDFPLAHLVMMRNFLYEKDLPEGMIDKILQEAFGMHLSFQVFKHYSRIPDWIKELKEKLKLL
jgi:WD40 repeat protein